MSLLTDPNDPDNAPIDIDEDGEQLGYPDDYEMDAQGRMMDEFPEVEPDAYLDAAYEDRFDMGDHYDF